MKEVEPTNPFRRRGLGIADKPAAPVSIRPEFEHRFEDVKIKLAGLGGQGVLLLGQLLIEMGMREGLEVSCFPPTGRKCGPAARIATWPFE